MQQPFPLFFHVNDERNVLRSQDKDVFDVTLGYHQNVHLSHWLPIIERYHQLVLFALSLLLLTS